MVTRVQVITNFSNRALETMPRASWTITGPICVSVYHSDDISAACEYGGRHTSGLLLCYTYTKHGTAALRKPVLEGGSRRHQLVQSRSKRQSPGHALKTFWMCLPLGPTAASTVILGHGNASRLLFLLLTLPVFKDSRTSASEINLQIAMLQPPQDFGWQQVTAQE